MDDIITLEHKKAAHRLKTVYATYKESEDMINIGAYTKGSNQKIDFAISMNEQIKDYLKQDVEENGDFDNSVGRLLNMFKNK